MTITDAELKDIQDDRLKYANERLDEIELEIGPITAESIARPIAQWLHQLSLIEYAIEHNGTTIDYNEQFRNRVQALADELDKAGNMLMTCLHVALCHKDKSGVAGAPIRAIFEAVTGLPDLRIELLDRAALRGEAVDR